MAHIIAALDFFSPGGFYAGLAIVGFALVAAVLLYFVIMSAIANRVNGPRKRKRLDE